MSSASRFATVSDEEFERILNEKNSINTNRATNVAWNTFKSYLIAKNLFDNFQVQSISKEELNNVLKKFYVEVRKNDGSLYRKNTYASIRFGLQRKFKEFRDIDIIEDLAFNESNNIFKARGVRGNLISVFKWMILV